MKLRFKNPGSLHAKTTDSEHLHPESRAQTNEEDKSTGPILAQRGSIWETENFLYESDQYSKKEKKLLASLWESEQRLRTALAHEQKVRAEAEARVSQLEATFEAITDGVCVYDTSGRFLHTNEAARELLAFNQQSSYTSYSPNERAFEHIPRDQSGKILPENEWPLSRILKGEVLKGATSVDLQMRTLDGRELQINASGAPIWDSRGSIIGGVIIFRDVTERRRMEQRARDTLDALLSMAEILVQVPGDNSEVSEYTAATASDIARKLAELTRSVLGCQRIAISIIEPETEVSHTLAVVGLSPEHEQQWWAEQQQKKGRLSDSPYPELVERLRANEVLLIDMMLPEFRNVPNPYNIGVVLIAPMCVGEQLVGTLTLDYGGAAHDYTSDEIALAGAVAKLAGLVIERERLLQDRSEARTNALALREANLRMDEFLGIVSHELRTPLTAIKGNIQLAHIQLKKIAEKIGNVEGVTRKIESIGGLLERADRQIGTQNRLVGDLLDVSRIQANKLEFRLVHYNLVDIVREAIHDQQQVVPMRTISLDITCEENIPVIADIDRIGQVVTNYLTNALKYSEFNRPVEVSVQSDGHIALVLVRDEGPGLPDTEQHRIWERFYRVEGIEVQSGTGIGLGLGLHICKTIIEYHQGQVGVQSVAGQGSTFWFTLPLAA